MIHQFEVTFTETIVRNFTFELDVEEDVDVDTLECSDIHEMIDRQSGWDQPEPGDWLSGSVEDRTVDDFEVAA